MYVPTVDVKIDTPRPEFLERAGKLRTCLKNEMSESIVPRSAHQTSQLCWYFKPKQVVNDREGHVHDFGEQKDKIKSWGLDDDEEDKDAKNGPCQRIQRGSQPEIKALN